MLANPGVPKYRLSTRSPVLNRRCRATLARVVLEEPLAAAASPSSSSSPEWESFAATRRSLSRWFSARSFRIS
ncbi:hypothetical protein Tdes44962_MAKER10307 [Teratosphaeria destructans]|uniref:Uncharacterized protein n=1 Tax=Teratosphaeria destructans TaxID=418781 RepID=A0A9W7VZS6_9PEZI|nr:hypothetical protein Tdes44962_MAKER10307 [Teratosphaeria destructans]